MRAHKFSHRFSWDDVMEEVEEVNDLLSSIPYNEVSDNIKVLIPSLKKYLVLVDKEKVWNITQMIKKEVEKVRS